MNGASIPSTWPALKTMAGELFRALPTASPEEAEAGFKCLALAYLGLEASPIERHQAVALMAIAGRLMVEHEAANGVPS